MEKYNEKLFEDIKTIDENGKEYWETRKLQEILGYKEWRNFRKVIEKAEIACCNSGFDINENFICYNKSPKEKRISRVIIDYKLSRYACYLIAMNSNSKIKQVALCKSYFANQTIKYDNISKTDIAMNMFKLTQKEGLLKRKELSGDTIEEIDEKLERVMNDLMKNLYGDIKN